MVGPKQVKYAVSPWINEAARRSDARSTDYYDTVRPKPPTPTPKR